MQTPTVWYSAAGRNRFPKIGDTVRMVGNTDWRWHGVIDMIDTERDSASVDGISVVSMRVVPCRVFEPLYREWERNWTKEHDAIAGHGFATVAEHAVEYMSEDLTRHDGIGWSPYLFQRTPVRDHVQPEHRDVPLRIFNDGFRQP